MKYKVLYPQLGDCLNRYRCVINGIEIIAIGDNKKFVLRKCLNFAKRGFYTELWYTDGNGVSNLISYWN